MVFKCTSSASPVWRTVALLALAAPAISASQQWRLHGGCHALCAYFVPWSTLCPGCPILTQVVAHWQGGYSLTLTLPEEDRYYGEKLDVLERNGLGASSTFALVRGQEPPEEMMAFLRLMQLSGERHELGGSWLRLITSLSPRL